MSGWSFYALGDPVPQGSKRHVGKGIMVESSKKLAPWRQTLVDAAWATQPRLEGPVGIAIEFTLPRPVSTPKRIVHPAKRPDLDKLVRAVFDAIGTAGLWNDDAQVVEVTAHKGWPGPEYLPVPGVVIGAAELPYRMAHEPSELAFEALLRACKDHKAAS